MKEKITIETTVNKPIETVWNFWTEPEHIKKWNNASDDWHTPKSSNDLWTGGKFSSTMAAKDGSMSFEFWGVYDSVITHQEIKSTLGDDRKVEVIFSGDGSETKIIETFEAESQNSVELQRAGWQAILDNFKKYAEAQ
ncbi:MAG: SRPBCC family protein [Crocinitomicaceae bacterium]